MKTLDELMQRLETIVMSSALSGSPEYKRQRCRDLIQLYYDQQNKELREENERLIAGIRRGQHLAENLKWSDDPNAEGFTANEKEIQRLTTENKELRQDLEQLMKSINKNFYVAEIQRLTKELDEVKTSHYQKLDAQLVEENERLTKEVENERLRLAACGVAALSNTDKSKQEHRLPDGSPYYSASYQDVCDAADREMALRKEVEELKERHSAQVGRAFEKTQEITRLQELVRKCREYIDGDRISWQSFPPKNDVEKLLQEVNTELLTEIDNALNHKP